MSIACEQESYQKQKKCRKRLYGRLAYAPEEVQHFGRLINFWSMAIDKKSNKTISSRKIKRKAKKLNIVDYMIFSIDAIQRMQATAWKDYKKVKPTAKQRREQFLEKRRKTMNRKMKSAQQIR